MTAPGRIARAAGLVLGTGYVLAFFSETVFWSLWRPVDELHGRLLTWLLYSLFGYLTLAAMHRFRVGDAWGVLLAGAFFGWLCEGVYAMTVFGDPSMPFPLTIVWTALAWHAPISLLVGWYGLGLALRDARPGPAILVCLGIGLFWGAWGLGWRAEAQPLVASPSGFLLHAAATTAGLGLAQLAIAAGRPEGWAPSRIGTGLAALAVLAFFALVTVPAIPMAILVLPPLLGLVWFGLRRRRARSEASVLARLAAPVVPRNLAALALIPVAATAIYAPASRALPPLGFVHPSFALVTSTLGLVLFGLAMAASLRRRA